MASTYGNPYGSAYSNPYANPYGAKGGASQEAIFQKQMASLAARLEESGYTPKPVDNRNWLEKLFDLLNRPVGATSSIAMGAFKPGSNLGEGFKQAGEVLTGQKKYGTEELLNDTLGKDDSWGRKLAAFGLSIPLDPLTWLPLEKLAKPILGAAAKGAKVAGLGKQVEAVGDVASGVKKFFGYDDFKRFKAVEPLLNEAGEVTFPGMASTQKAGRAITNVVGSQTARAGSYQEQLNELVSGLQGLLNKATPEQKKKIMLMGESHVDVNNKMLADALKIQGLDPGTDTLLLNYRQKMKELGDMLEKSGLIAKEKVGKKAARIGGEESEGYITHVLNPEFKQKFKTLDEVPAEFRAMVKPFYELNGKSIIGRKLPGSILDNNVESVAKTGVKIFLDDPTDILKSYVATTSKVLAQSDIVKIIKSLMDDAGKGGVLQQFDDTSIDSWARELLTKKGDDKKQLVQSVPAPQMRTIIDFFKEKLSSLGHDPNSVSFDIPKGLAQVTNPVFSEPGKKIASSPEIAKLLNQLTNPSFVEAKNPTLDVFDKIQRAWKAMAVLSPRFHVNNFVGATSNNMIDDALGTITSQGLVQKMLKGGDEILNLGKNQPQKTAAEWLKLFKDNGLVSGMVTNEMGVNSKNLLTNLPKGVSQASQKVGGLVEEQVRATAFINNLKKGMNPDEAMQRVFQIHGNYNPEAMSKFEKDVVKRIIPFYTWMKTSMPYQLQSLYKKTGIYSALGRGEQMANPDRESLPEWMRGRINLPATTGKDGKKYVGSIPMSVTDLELLFDPLKNIQSKLSPMVKIPMELSTNRNTFWDQDIVNKDLPKEMQTSAAPDYIVSLMQLMDKIGVGTPAKKVINYQENTDETGQKKMVMDSMIKYLLGNVPMTNTIGNLPKNMNNELGAASADSNFINSALAALWGQVNPTAPKPFDPVKEKYFGERAKYAQMQEMLRYLVSQGLVQSKR